METVDDPRIVGKAGPARLEHCWRKKWKELIRKRKEKGHFFCRGVRGSEIRRWTRNYDNATFMKKCSLLPVLLQSIFSFYCSSPPFLHDGREWPNQNTRTPLVCLIFSLSLEVSSAQVRCCGWVRSMLLPPSFGLQHSVAAADDDEMRWDGIEMKRFGRSVGRQRMLLLRIELLNI